MSRRVHTIAAADVDEKARTWLETHGAKINGCLIDLPETLVVEKHAQWWDYTITEKSQGHEAPYLVFELDVDVDESKITWHKGEYEK